MNNQNWDVVIDAKKSGGRSGLKNIYQYRDLLWLIVRRDFVSFYKQTILGPVWFFIKPVFSSIVYLFIFGTLAGLSQDGIPPILFYISGLTLWSYFSETVLSTSDVLKTNAPIFGKVYFPRLIMPISILFSNGVKLIIQVSLIILLMVYFYLVEGQGEFTFNVLLVPLIILIVALQAFGVGLIVAAVSIKYRDISMLIGNALQLGLFITPVVFPLSSVGGNFKLLLSLNPMTYPIELFRFAFFGSGTFSFEGIVYMFIATSCLVILGVFSFNKAEKTFIDTI